MGLFRNRKKAREEAQQRESEYLEKLNIPECVKQDFRMTIDDIFTVMGIGTIVTGTVESGTCRIGNNVVILQQMGKLESTVTKIDLNGPLRRPDNACYATERVGLALRGISKDQLHVGDVIVQKNARD